MTIKPLQNRVVIKFVEAEEKTKGGIILTASAQEKPQIAEVVAVGPGKIEDGNLVPVSVKVGERLLHASMQVQQLSSTVLNTLFSPKTIFSQLLNNSLGGKLKWQSRLFMELKQETPL